MESDSSSICSASNGQRNSNTRPLEVPQLLNRLKERGLQVQITPKPKLDLDYKAIRRLKKCASLTEGIVEGTSLAF